MLFQALPRVDTYSTPYLKIILFIVIKKNSLFDYARKILLRGENQSKSYKLS